jgi:hypothetical protein
MNLTKLVSHFSHFSTILYEFYKFQPFSNPFKSILKSDFADKPLDFYGKDPNSKIKIAIKSTFRKTVPGGGHGGGASPVRLAGGGEEVGEGRELTGVRAVERDGVEEGRRGAGGGRRGAAAADTVAATAFRRGGSPGGEEEGRVSFTGSKGTLPGPWLGRRSSGGG